MKKFDANVAKFGEESNADGAPGVGSRLGL